MSSNTKSTAIRSTDIPTILKTFYGTRRVPYFRGQPGIGKTDLVHEGAKQITADWAARNAVDPNGKPFQMAVYELHLASMSEVDIRGYLIPDGSNARFTKPVFADVMESNPCGILFLDEFPQATHEVQKAVAPLLLDGRIGDWKMPAGWMVATAGNREDDNSGINSLLGHIINRLCILDVNPPELDAWVAWGVNHAISHEILTFAKIKPDTIFGKPNLKANDEPYCTPRSIHALDDVAKHWPNGISGLMQHKTGLAIADGLIGRGAAAELAAVVNLTIKLPTYEQVVADPHGTVIPTKPDETYAMLMSVALRAKQQDSGPVVDYLTRFDPNFAVVGLSALLNRGDADFTSEPSMGTWIAKNKDLVMKMHKYIRTGG